MTTRENMRLRLEYRDPAGLAKNGLNWRDHPPAQLAALKEVIGEVGWAGALLFNERTGRLIDGHARRKVVAEGGKVPVLIGSWSEEQERLILATLDPLTAMANANALKLAEHLGEVETTSEAIRALLDGINPPSAYHPETHAKNTPGRAQILNFFERVEFRLDEVELTCPGVFQGRRSI